MKKWGSLFITILSLMVLSGCSLLAQVPYSGNTMQEKMMAARSDIRQTNVGIETSLFSRSGTLFQRVASRSQGSGVLFSEDEDFYYVLTNHHVVDATGYAKAEYKITTFAGYQADAYLVDSNEALDLAIIRFSKIDQSLDLMNIYERENKPLVRNEMVLAVGNPSGVNNIVTFGEFISMATINSADFQVIYHSALIYPGNSGGALADLDGNLVGINTWGSVDSDEKNFAVPLTVVLNYLKELGF